MNEYRDAEAEEFRQEQRRALNMIWTAAEDYSFRPVFMAFDKNGKADIYLNSVIGWAHRWYESEELKELADSFEGTALQNIYDIVYWLCLESCVYDKEKRNRPVINELRQDYAKRIMEEAERSTEQNLALTLRNGYFGKVLGIKTVLLPWEQKLLQAMELEGNLTNAEVCRRIRAILQEYFHYQGSAKDDRRTGEAGKHFRFRLPFLKKRPVRVMVTRLEYDGDEEAEDSREDSGMRDETENRKPGMLEHFLGELWESNRSEWTREYIETCFGSPLYNEKEIQKIENLLCTGNHGDCRLYFTRGAPRRQEDCVKAAGWMADESRRRQRLALEQEKKNRDYYDTRRDVHRSCILKLKEQIANTLLVEQEPETVVSRMGTLDGTRVWKERYLRDNRVFTRTTREDRSPFSVDIMLDSSASQLHRQEMIASQGYIIAESLRLCGIPAQIYSFCSFYGYTVFSIFREYKDVGDNQNIFRYSACGWNRDGLALRGAGYLMEQSPAPRRLLIILTDASPNDDKKMPSRGKGFGGREYESDAGIRDAADEVRKLRKKGIRVIGVFYGLDQELDGAKKIYGCSFARIKDPRQLADTVGGLIREEVKRMETS